MREIVITSSGCLTCIIADEFGVCNITREDVYDCNGLLPICIGGFHPNCPMKEVITYEKQIKKI